jgi:Fe-S oxidoreductase
MPPPGSASDRSPLAVTIHDPCYLARHNGEHWAPRRNSDSGGAKRIRNVDPRETYQNEALGERWKTVVPHR